MTADPLGAWWVHDLSVERWTEALGYGSAKYDAAVTVTGFYDDTTIYAGTELIANGRFAFPADVAPIPLQSRVTLPARFGSRVAQVVESRIGDAGSLPLPAHQEIRLL